MLGLGRFCISFLKVFCIYRLEFWMLTLDITTNKYLIGAIYGWHLQSGEETKGSSEVVFTINLYFIYKPHFFFQINHHCLVPSLDFRILHIKLNKNRGKQKKKKAAATVYFLWGINKKGNCDLRIILITIKWLLRVYYQIIAIWIYHLLPPKVPRFSSLWSKVISLGVDC